MKTCKKCNIQKEDSYFFKDKKSFDGLQSYCKQCKSIYNVNYYKSNPDKIVKKSREKRLKDYYKDSVHQNIARILRKDLKDSKKDKTFSILGYTIGDLKSYLESKFQKGMSWENYGKWHIDHKIPRSALPYSTIEDENFKRCWDINNLQPLWETDNLKKSNKMAHSSIG